MANRPHSHRANQSTKPTGQSVGIQHQHQQAAKAVSHAANPVPVAEKPPVKQANLPDQGLDNHIEIFTNTISMSMNISYLEDIAW